MVVFLLRNVLLVMIPFSIIFYIFSKFIIHVLFQRGVFDAYSVQITASTLKFYALGLVSFAGVKILVTAFHALQDTKTPVKIAAITLIINVILKFTLMFPLKISGIALASSISATINFILLLCLLIRKLKHFH